MISLEKMNQELIFLMQACFGVIHDDFLYIGLDENNEVLLLKMIIRKNSEDIQEAIGDIVADFESFHNDIKYELIVEIANEFNKYPSSNSEKSRGFYRSVHW